MTRNDVFEKLNEVFQDVFDDENIVIGENTAIDSGDIEDWDSLEHVNLVLAVEQYFGIKFNGGEVSSMKNVGTMVDVILKKLQ